MYGDGVPKFENTVKTEIERLVERIKNFDGEGFDICPVLERSLGNLMSILVCGEPMSDSANQIVWDYVNSSNESLNPTVEFFLYSLPFLRFLPGKYKRICDTEVKARRAFAETFVRSYQNTYVPGKERAIVDVFIKLTARRKEEWINVV